MDEIIDPAAIPGAPSAVTDLYRRKHKTDSKLKKRFSSSPTTNCLCLVLFDGF